MSSTVRFQTVHGLAAGIIAGMLISVVPACGKTTPPPPRCGSDTCDGCCDDQNNCYSGVSAQACGLKGITCQVCMGSQVCASDGNCRIPGDGGTGGGIEGGGGGTGTGGTSGTGGHGGGSSSDGGCSMASCPNGCCSTMGQCIAYQQQGFSKCGTAGATCKGCPVGQSCNSGTCGQPACSGCLDGTGNCRTDMTDMNDNYCGTGGVLCRTCDTVNGAKCQAGVCTGTSTMCNSTNCDGCCSGNICIGASDGGINDAQCGVGAASCVTCTNATCNKDAGVCAGGGNDGGFFPFPDGGFATCDATNCTTCCDFLLGCVPDGTAAGLPGLPLFDCSDPAGAPGDPCQICTSSMCGSALNICL